MWQQMTFSEVLELGNSERRFDGETVSDEDTPRLSKQLDRVRALMSDQAWRTPEEMEQATGYRWASINARLRDLRKVRFGSRTVERKGMGKGLFQYRLLP